MPLITFLFLYDSLSLSLLNHSFWMKLMDFNNSYQEADLVKLDILLNGQPVDAMATIVHNLKAQRVGRELVEKLKKFIDRSPFEFF